MKAGFCLLLCFVITGCTSIKVTPVTAGAALSKVCIVDNPKVQVADFMDVLRDGFNRHNIATTVVTDANATSCDVTVTYTALRSWDISSFLSHAELRLWRGGRQLGSAQYHLNGKGGFSLTKWQSTKTKMDPVIDQLLRSN